jgi:hypothetical protein
MPVIHISPIALILRGHAVTVAKGEGVSRDHWTILRDACSAGSSG